MTPDPFGQANRVSTKEVKTQVAIVGAGYAGLSAYLTLRRRLDWNHQTLSLVNKHAYHYFTTELHTLVGGAEDEESVSIALGQVVRRPATLLLAEADRILPEESRLVLKPAPGSLARVGTAHAYFSLRYDYLVVALGSEPEYFNLPGVRENSVVVHSLRSAEALQTRLNHLATLGGAGGFGEVIIAGGGLTGVELATEIADAYGRHLRVTLVEAAPEVMPGLDPYLAKVSRRSLEDKGVTILTGVPVLKAEPERLFLKGGAVIPFDLLVWAGGVRGPALLAKSGLAVTPRGRGLVSGSLQAKGYPNIYLVGDCAAFKDPATGLELPPTAQAAVQMGHAAGQAVLARLQGLEAPTFRPNIKGVFVSLGRDEGVGNIGHSRYEGVPAVVIKELIQGHHAFEAGGMLQILRRLFRRRRPMGIPAQPLLRRPAAPTLPEEPPGPELHVN